MVQNHLLMYFAHDYVVTTKINTRWVVASLAGHPLQCLGVFPESGPFRPSGGGCQPIR